MVPNFYQKKNILVIITSSSRSSEGMKGMHTHQHTVFFVYKNTASHQLSSMFSKMLQPGAIYGLKMHKKAFGD